jgi:adenylate kinase family enzyme
MGVTNYLIEGVSGAGKTAVCTELQRRGYQAIHGDRELVYRGDPQARQTQKEPAMTATPGAAKLVHCGLVIGVRSVRPGLIR